ncbi:MAG TPA: helix-turn-helix domain-containing protein, partial [Pedobacter sp.]
MNNKHHGQLIEKIIRRNGHSITDIARLTHVNRRSVYNWFNQARLKPRTISSIGDAIQYDFTGVFPEYKDEISP